jgi:hypothetical protein
MGDNINTIKKSTESVIDSGKVSRSKTEVKTNSVYVDASSMWLTQGDYDGVNKYLGYRKSWDAHIV